MRSEFYSRVIIALFLILFFVVLLRNAWLGDDAFITCRTVDNFVNGYGLTWNPDERVQAFTHPLWMFFILAIYGLTHEMFFSTIFLSILVSLVTVTIFSLKVARTATAAVLGMTLFLLSKAFIDYSTSGLENPLSHLIMVLFYWVYFRSEHNLRTLFVLSLIASFGVFNRMDTFLLFLPAIIYLFFRLPKLRALYVIAAGFIPFILWISFALFYYGFPFPNTAYAKLSTGIDSLVLIEQGITYLRNACERNPVSALIIFGAIIFSFRAKSRNFIPLSLGIVLYLLYVVRIGGDFMSGRFLSAPFLGAVLLISQWRFTLRAFDWWIVGGAVVILGLVWPRCPLWSGAAYGLGPEKSDWDKGISDERAGYFQRNSLLNADWWEEQPSDDWSRQGRLLREVGDTVVVRCGIGSFGYCAGPRVHIVDRHALTDPILARLPITSLVGWRIGHFRRMLPEGYLATLMSGENRILDADLAEYYDKMCQVVRGSLFHRQRLLEIAKFNLGFNDYLLERYLSRPLMNVSYDKVSAPLPQGTPFNSNFCFLLSKSGMNIDLNGVPKSSRLEISVDNNDDYEIAYSLDALEVGSQLISARWIPEHGLRVDTINIIAEAVEKGFDRITVKPVSGDGGYSLGHIRFLAESSGPDDGESLEQLLYSLGSRWPDARLIQGTHSFGIAITMKALYTVAEADSIHFLFVFRADRDMKASYKIFFHVVTLDDERFHNFDFLPKRRTDSWSKGDIILCQRSIPNLQKDFRYSLGFFHHDTRLGEKYKGLYSR